MSAEHNLGINGFGRIGKLTLWYHLARDAFQRFTINVGREVSMPAMAQYIAKDTTYGPLHRYLEGQKGARSVVVEDESRGILRVHGKRVEILSGTRNPRELCWRTRGVGVVADTTGAFLDPGAPADAEGGALRGHLEAGARAVVVSSPFKSASHAKLPEDALTLIFGINHHRFDPKQHALVSAASCTTTALAHMLRPLLDRHLGRRILTAGMSTVHAATNSQPILDSVPKAGAKDLRKTRSVLDNIIITSTNAAKALEQVMPEIGRIGFMADSVRIPTSTVSLIILNLTFQSETGSTGTDAIDREAINQLYREAAAGESRGLLTCSEEQNVSADLMGEDAAVVIEAAETHTRTGFVDLLVPGTGRASDEQVRIPLIHAKIFGWYDNEMGSYTFRMGELTSHIAKCL